MRRSGADVDPDEDGPARGPRARPSLDLVARRLFALSAVGLAVLTLALDLLNYLPDDSTPTGLAAITFAVLSIGARR